MLDRPRQTPLLASLTLLVLFAAVAATVAADWSWVEQVDGLGSDASGRGTSARTTISTGFSRDSWISRTTRRAPSASGIRPTPSLSNSGRSAGVTMPPSQGPQLNETTRHSGSRRAWTWAHLLSTSLAAAYATCPTSPISVAGLGNGTHTYSAFQTDAAGNPGPELLREFTVDLTPPAAPQITSGPSGRTSQAAPSFAFSGETGAGFSCSIDGDAPVACDGGQFTAAPLTDGVHSFQVSQTDGAGNAGPEATREFTVDTTAPAAPQITAGPAGLTIEAAPTFAFSGEAGAGFSCAIDGDAPVACDAGSFHVATLADGKHSFRVLQTDSAGNAGPEATREFTVDTTAPAAPQITAGPTDQTSEVSPTFAFVGERQASFRCAFDGGAPVACDGGSFTPAAPLADGKHSFRVSQTDAAGNAGPEATREFTVGAGSNGGGPPPVVTPRDTTPPDTKIKGPKRVRKPIAKFKLSSTEVGSKFQCKLDRKRFRPCRPKLKAKKLKRGKHVLKVRAVDAAGNVDPTPAKKVFRVGH